MNTGYDPRAVANRLLDIAQTRQVSLTHISLQKLLYFAHGEYLSATKQPLLNGYFEAWQYGPVHPGVYGSFKRYGPSCITGRAKHFNFVTQSEEEIFPIKDDVASKVITRLIDNIGTMSPARLVAISHAERGPWAHVVSQRFERTIFGTRIDNDTILARYKYHKIPLESETIAGDPREDSPLE
jgi:uncharacterized phage-associated protein